MPINKFSEYTKKFLKPVEAINKKIHEATGHFFGGSGIPKKEEGSKGSASFRQVGSMPEDKSGFPVQHLGDNK